MVVLEAFIAMWHAIPIATGASFKEVFKTPCLCE